MSKEEAQLLLNECRDLIESKGETCPVYVGFEKETYELSKDEMYKIYKCLYVIDYELNQNKELKISK